LILLAIIMNIEGIVDSFQSKHTEIAVVNYVDLVA